MDGVTWSVSAREPRRRRCPGGDKVDVDIELDTEKREVAVPADFAAALDAEPEPAAPSRAVVQQQVVACAPGRGRQDRRDAPASHRQVGRNPEAGPRPLIREHRLNGGHRLQPDAGPSPWRRRKGGRLPRRASAEISNSSLLSLWPAPRHCWWPFGWRSPGWRSASPLRLAGSAATHRFRQVGSPGSERSRRPDAPFGPACHRPGSALRSFALNVRFGGRFAQHEIHRPRVERRGPSGVADDDLRWERRAPLHRCRERGDPTREKRYPSLRSMSALQP